MSFYKYGNLHGYQKKYKRRILRKRGFETKALAERDLRRAMDDIDAEERGEIRVRPTTMQDALALYERVLTVRARDKGVQFGHSARHLIKQLNEFVKTFGTNRLVRECTETDLREFYQTLCFRISRNSAGTVLGRVQGMLKEAQRSRPDLVHWVRPTIKVSHKSEHERRVVEDWEYATLVTTLLSPRRKGQHGPDSTATRRDAADVVQLLRLTGGRLNEIVHIRLDQFEWSRSTVLLFASKTESERRVPLVSLAAEVVQRRIREGLTDGEFVFPKCATSVTYDRLIAQRCVTAGREAKLSYGRENGFTCHSLRHTFITSMMRATNNDVGTVMQWSGHRSLESFKTYIQPTGDGCKLGTQALERVDPFLILSERNQGQQGDEGERLDVAKVVSFK